MAGVSEALIVRNVYACEVLGPVVCHRLVMRRDWTIAKLYRYAKRVEPERGRRWRLVVEDAPRYQQSKGSP